MFTLSYRGQEVTGCKVTRVQLKPVTGEDGVLRHEVTVEATVDVIGLLCDREPGFKEKLEEKLDVQADLQGG